VECAIRPDLEATIDATALLLLAKGLMERSAGTAARSAPTPEAASVWEDFLDIFYAPSSVFARRENGSFWIPLFVVCVAIGILFFVNSAVMEPIMNAEMARGIAAARSDPRMTPEAAAQMQSMGAMIGRVTAFIATPFVILCIALALWVTGKLVGARQSWHAALVVAAYAYVPKILESVLAGVQGFLVDPEELDGRFRLTLGVGRFLDPDTTSPVLVALLGRLDVFTIWVTVLLAIGLAVTGRVDRGRAALAGVIVWALGALPGVLPALSAARQG
jgi:hypothetical protein